MSQIEDRFSADSDGYVTFGTFHCGGQEFTLPAQQIREVVTYSSTLVALPGFTPHVLGALSLRDEVIPIVDMQSLFGGEKTKPTSNHRIVVVDCGERLVGALVEDTGSVMRVPEDCICDIEGESQLVEGVVRIPGTQRILTRIGKGSFDSIPAFASSARARETNAEPKKLRQFVTLEVSELELAVPMEYTLEVQAPLPRSESLPYFDHCIGTVRLREANVAVLDLSHLLARTPLSAENSKLVFVHFDNAVIALPVNHVKEVVTVTEDECVELDLPGAHSESSFARHVIRRDNKSDVTCLDIPTLFAKCQINSELPDGIGKGLLNSSVEEKDELHMAAFFLGFNVGDIQFALDMTAVREIKRIPKDLLPVPGTTGALCGLLNVRGEIIPVLDLRQRYEMPDPEVQKGRRIVIVEVDGSVVGIVVDALTEIIKGEDTLGAGPTPATMAAGTVMHSAAIEDTHQILRLGERHGMKVVLLMDPQRLREESIQAPAA